MLKPDPTPSAEAVNLVAALEPAGARPVARLPHRRATLGALLWKWVLRLVPIVLLVAAAIVLWREFHALSLDEVSAVIVAWGPGPIIAALALSAFSFGLMGVVEWLGLRWAGSRLPWARAMAGSFLANAVAHSLGANLLVAGAIRARIYDRFGVTLTQVAATTLFNGMSFAVGLSALGGGGLLLATDTELSASAIPIAAARALGLALLCAPAAYILICTVRRAPLRAFGRSMTLPTAKDAISQLAIGVLDNGVAAAIIWILLPAGTVSYDAFVGAYAIAAVAGLISTIPGGAGVFEGSISTMLPHAASAALAAAFLGYRLAYYLLPLLIASGALAWDSLDRRRQG